jgi:hypothetical protein
MNFPENNPFPDNMVIRIHNLIKTKTTCTPKQLARKVACSERTIFNKIALLKQSDFPVFSLQFLFSMKRFYFVFTLIVFLVSSAVYSKPFDYRAYNTEINKAELAIINNNYRVAARCYHIAFNMGAIPSPTDLHNALVLAIKMKDEKRSFQYAGQLAQLGVGSAYFERQAKFNWLKTQSGWLPLLKTAQSVKEHIALKNAILLNRLSEMSVAYDDALDKLHKTQPSDVRWDELYQVEKTASRQLFELFKDKGYLSPREIGVHVKNDTILSDPVFTSILKWNGILPSGEMTYNNLFVPILDTAMKQGIISTDFYRRMIRSELTTSISLPPVLRVDCKLYMDKHTSAYFKKTEDARKAIGLCSYQEYIQKLQFNAKKPSSSFYIYPQVPQQPILRSWIETYRPDFFNKVQYVTSIINCIQRQPD